LERSELHTKRQGWRLAKRVWRDKGVVIGGLIVMALVIMALAPSAIAPTSPTKIVMADRLGPPSLKYPLGTDEMGRDVLSRVIHAARVSLMVSLGGVTGAMIIGSLIGVIAALASTRVDNLIMRVLDVFLAFPTILLALTIMASIGTGLKSIIIAIAVVYTPRFSRMTRGATLVVREQTYIEAARAIGAPYWRLISRHILPNIASVTIVQFTVYLGFAILVEAALSFLGLGVQPPQPAWGSMLSRGKTFMEISPWVVIGPGLAIMATVLGFNLLGDGLRDILDPRLMER
jgi:peptide/nickel transport system permease protein